MFIKAICLMNLPVFISYALPTSIRRRVPFSTLLHTSMLIKDLYFNSSRSTCQKHVLYLHLLGHHFQSEYQLRRYRPSSKSLHWTSNKFAVNQRLEDVSSLTFCKFDEHGLEFHDIARNEIVAYPPLFGRCD
jgi:hypothetical protein